ncbi:MAG: GNAT family N-acetyltransferase [Candidatus Omnitrophica bacterium]|nr:GNAT family N-acetyltransferase [Candidatus Omnitrophota bacterium]
MNPSKLKASAAAGLERAGAASLLRTWIQGQKPQHLAVLMYHRLFEKADPYFPGTHVRDFEMQIRHLAEHWHPVSEAEVSAHYIEGKPLPKGAVLVTFDDGFKDTRTLAWPVLKRYRVPGLVFLATDCIGTGKYLWTEELTLLIKDCSSEFLHLTLGNKEWDLVLSSAEDRIQARDALKSYLKTLPNAQREKAMNTLRQRLIPKPDANSEAPMLDWEDVKALASEGMAIGAHTVTHPILSQVPEAQARAEIFESGRAVEKATGRFPLSFCYPNGRAADFNAETQLLVLESGYQLAFTTEEGVNTPNTDPTALLRLPTAQVHPALFSLGLIRDWQTRADRASKTQRPRKPELQVISHLTDSIKSQWEALHSEAGANRFFLSWAWISNWWKHFGTPEDLRLLVFIDQDQWVGAVPFYLKQGRLSGVPGVRQIRFVGDGANVASDHLGFLARPGYETLVAEGAADYWSKSADWDSIYLRGFPQEDPALRVFIQCLEGHGYKVSEAPMAEACPYIALPKTWDEYLGSLSDNMKRNVKRRRRKIEREHKIQSLSFESPAQVEEGMQALRVLHAQSKTLQGIPSKFEDPAYAGFHLDLARELSRTGKLYLSALAVDGKPAAIQYGFKTGKQLCAYQTGFDPEYRQLGVFQIHFGNLIEEAITGGLEEIDLLRGDESYKYDWTQTERRNAELRVHNRTLRGRLSGLANRFVKRRKGES